MQYVGTVEINKFWHASLFFFFHLLGFGERCAYLVSNSILNRIASKGGYLWRTKNKGDWGLLRVGWTERCIAFSVAQDCLIEDCIMGWLLVDYS